MTGQDLDGLLALALSRPREALARARELLAADPSPAVAAVAHQAAGIVLRDFGDIEESLTDLRAARRSARRAGDGEREADIRATYGATLVFAGRTRRGLTEVEAAARGAVGPAAGRIHFRRAYILHLLGRHAEMLDDAETAARLLAGHDPVWEARAHNLRAVAYQALGAFDRADADYESCEQLLARTGQRLEFASARHDRGAAAFARGDLPRAMALLDDAQHIVDELEVFEPDVAITRTQVLLAAGLARDARVVADEAVEQSERIGGSRARRAELLHAAALAAYACGDLPGAQDRSARALVMFRDQHRDLWAARAQLTNLQSRFDDGEIEPSVFRAGRRLAAQLDRLDPARAADAHLLTGRLGLALGRPDAAAELAAAATGKAHDLRSRSAGWLARAVLAQSEERWAAMLGACTRGLHLIDKHRRTLGATELRAWATAQGSELSTMALRHAVRTEDARRLLEWSERWRAVALAVPPLAPDDDEEMARDLLALRTLTHRLDGERARGEDTAALRQEQHRLEDVVRRRTLRAPGAGGPTPPALDVARLREHLGPAVLIELVDVDGQLHAVVVHDQSPPRSYPVGPTADAERALAQALFALRREASRRGTQLAARTVDRTAPQLLSLDRLGTHLQERLLGPVAGQLDGRPVVLVPTGRLHAVPWGLMPALRERAFTVSPSASAWLRARRTSPSDPGGRVVLVGGPGLGAGGEEVERLSRLYPDAVVLADGRATCGRTLEAMDGAALVHVAAHGTFRADNPLLSALQLDDGPLTVYDLERLGRAPHRVVLSSCNSAVGAPTGADELLGVVSALIALGSAGIVASVVPVDDPSTVPFMTELHRGLPEASLGEAMARARRAAGDDPLARCTASSFIALGA